MQYQQINIKLNKAEYDRLRQLYYEMKMKGEIKTWADFIMRLADVYQERRLVLCT